MAAGRIHAVPVLCAVTAGILAAFEPGDSPWSKAVRLATVLCASSAGPGGKMPAATKWQSEGQP